MIVYFDDYKIIQSQDGSVALCKADCKIEKYVPFFVCEHSPKDMMCLEELIGYGKGIIDTLKTQIQSIPKQI